MNENTKKSYIAWLNDAYALEQSLITMLERQVEETEDMPSMQARIKEHLDETKDHAEQIKGCIERHGESVSTIKEITGKIGSAMQGFGMSLADDVVVKHMHAGYVSEQVEIATYTLISAAARKVGDAETATICEAILKEEERMADWLIKQLPQVGVMHLDMQATKE